MSREMLEAMTVLAREKNIAPEKLMDALADALLSAYKMLPGAARYARVEIDHESPQAFGECSRGEPERHGGLSHAPLEGADAEYMHE